MKRLLLIIMVLGSLTSFAQTSGEKELTALSGRIFRWEVAGQMDSLAEKLHEKFAVMSSPGVRQTKAQYLARLSSGSFVHNTIEVQESTATITAYTGIVTGKGKFTVTNNGQQSTLALAYTEVFIRSGSDEPWMLLSIHANPLPASTH